MTGGSAAGGAARATSKWLAFVAGVPLAAWLSLGALRPATAQPPAPPPPASAIAPSPPPAATAATPPGPPSYCVQRFLAPLEAMAGQLPAKDAAPSDDLKATGTFDGQKLELDITRPSRPPARTWLERIDAAMLELTRVFAGDGGPASVKTMIATIPDVVDSGLGYQFETALQALRRGVEAEVGAKSYFRDRSFLPWDDRGAEAAQQRDSVACRTSTPGLILFRGGDANRGRLFAMLLVGESPTTGLRQAAMLTALEVEKRFAQYREQQSGDGERAREIPIIGPTFSGSAQSLRLVLKNFADPDQNSEPVTFRIISGTATGSRVPGWLGRRGEPLTATSTISYAATTVPAAAVECSYLSFLAHRLGVPDDGREPATLSGVATLSESGTEFGATTEGPGCRYRAGHSLHFPFHVSSLRDAYEDLDQQGSQAKKDAGIARATSLDVSLREGRVPLDVESAPSQKTRTAQDIALVHVLERISTSHVRHLAIHATDVGDAIFLARKIRDVAPDVRLAFFDADALLLHANFRRELIGSLVVSPYPFLGLAEFAQPANSGRTFDGFESGNAEGLFNAVLAQRGASPKQLKDYLIGSHAPLPTWISTIGRGVLVPARVRATADCEGTIYGSEPAERSMELERLCELRKLPRDSLNPGQRQDIRRAFNDKYSAELRLLQDAKTPYTWSLIFAALAFASWLDRKLRERQRRRFTEREIPEGLNPMTPDGLSPEIPDELRPHFDQLLDQTIARTKWRLYDAIRSFLFVLGLGYMAAIYLLGLVVHGGLSFDALVEVAFLEAVGAAVGTVLVILAVADFVAAITRYRNDYGTLADRVGSSLLPWKWRDVAEAMDAPESAGPDAPTSSEQVAPRSQKPLVQRLTLGFGIAEPDGRIDAARASFAQLRIVTVAAVLIALFFSAVLLYDFLRTSPVLGGEGFGGNTRLILMLIRSANLTSGVSPSTPALLCIACVYVWCYGRMARLLAAHRISASAPPDGETDLVSTPIRLVLYPEYVRTGKDLGFTGVERDLMNTIWRPITGTYYVAATLTIAVFPIVVFTLKRLSTLESGAGTWFLGAGLALCSFLIGVTLVQLVQYWFAFERLLKRTMEHPLGPAFGRVPDFARDSVDRQVSRRPDDSLRWSSCALLFCSLMRSAGAVVSPQLLAARRDELDAHARELDNRRTEALKVLGGKRSRAQEQRRASAPPPSLTEATHPQDALTREVIRAAGTVTALLEVAWRSVGKQTQLPAASAGRDTPSAGPNDALTPAESALGSELYWLRSAQTFVAAVVTLLIHRHARQFRYFLWATTLGSLLLLLAVATYPFEPYRLILTYLWIVTGSVVGVCFWVYMRMDRNTWMSLVAGTSPNEVTLDRAFWLRVLAWVVVPLLGVAAAQYPELANFLYNLVGPFTRALR
jgi:hypothetical protein